MIQATTNFNNWIENYTGGKVVYAIEIDGYDRTFTNENGTGATGEFPYLDVESSDDLSLSLSDLDGGSDQQGFQFTVQDAGALITGDFPGFVFEGKTIAIKMGSLDLAYADYCTIFTGMVDSVDSASDNLAYSFNLVDLTQQLQKPVYLAGDNGLPTSSSNLRTLQGHPLDIMSDIILNQLGVDPALYDSTTVDTYRDGLFNGLEFKFKLDQAPNALDFIQKQIMKPLGGYIWCGGSGKISVHFFYPITAPTAVMTIDETLFLDLPLAEQTDLVNTVQYQFDKADGDGGGGYSSQDTEEYGPSVSLYGQVGEQVITSDGMRSAFQGFFWSKLISRMIFLRYGKKSLKFDQYASPTQLRTMLLEPGDIVAVTHHLVPDRTAGVIGVTGKLFEVIGKVFSLGDIQATLSMIDADYLTSFGSFLIAPAGHADYASSSTADKAKYLFLTNDAGKYSTGADGNVLG